MSKLQRSKVLIVAGNVLGLIAMLVLAKVLGLLNPFGPKDIIILVIISSTSWGATFATLEKIDGISQGKLKTGMMTRMIVGYMVVIPAAVVIAVLAIARLAV